MLMMMLILRPRPTDTVSEAQQTTDRLITCCTADLKYSEDEPTLPSEGGGPPRGSRAIL